MLHVFRIGTVRIGSAAPGLLGGERRGHERSVWAYVLEHPKEGLAVIDTGLHRSEREKKGESGGLLGTVIETELGEDGELPAQMKEAGLDPGDVRWVLLSDLRITKAGEAEAFHQARVVVTRRERDAAREGGAFYAQRYLDDVESWKFVDWNDAEPLGTMRAASDLFGDGSVMALDASGPTAGTMAFLVRLPARPVLLAGDLAPSAETVRYAAKPEFLEDADAWWDRIWRLKRFADLDPELLVVPGDDATPLRGVAGVVWHEAEKATPGARATPSPPGTG